MTTIQASLPAQSPRIQSIDLLRGIIMNLMPLDHSRGLWLIIALHNLSPIFTEANGAGQFAWSLPPQSEFFSLAPARRR